MSIRRTQAERRQATRRALLSAARHQFGEFGYSKTSLDEIAVSCNVTIRPIYHYFKSKLGLFTAVIEEIEGEMIDDIAGRENVDPKDIWIGFMTKCEDPHFRQIILLDGPNLLGRSRMMDGAIAKAVRKRMADMFDRPPDGLSVSLLLGALTQAALYIAENGVTTDDYEKIRELIDFQTRQIIKAGYDS